MKTKEFLDLFGEDHLFSAYDYQKVMPAIGNQTSLKEMRKLNRKGYCVFFAVNSFNNEKRNNKNIRSVRAIWVDDDNPRKSPRKKWPIPPSIIVSSSEGKYQYYWLTETTEFDEFELVMQTMIDEHGNDKGVRDLARVLRLPNFYHNKNLDNARKVKVVGGSLKKHSWEKIKIAFPPAKELKASTKREGKYDKKTAKKAIKNSDDFHGSLRDRAMELANRKLDTDEIIAILQQDMERVPEADRDKRWQDRMSEEHLFECANSAVEKYAAEEHEDGEEYEFADISNFTNSVRAKKLPLDIIVPPDTAIGELTMALHETWWVPNIMVAGLAARSIVAYLAGGKYASTDGDRVNIQQIAIGETGCGKDLLFNQFGKVMDCIFLKDEKKKQIAGGIMEEVGSPEGIDLKLRTVGAKHDVIWLQDEVGGLMQAAKKDNRKREILEMLLKFYTKADETVNERALVKKLPEKASEILYAPHIILSGATTPRLITTGLDSTFLSYGSASRMIFFPVTQYVEKHLRERKKLKIRGKLRSKLRVIEKHRSDKERQYPASRIHKPVLVEFDEKAKDLCYETTVKNSKFRGLEAEVWNRHVANSKKYAMIDAIAENPEEPIITHEIMKRNLKLVGAACEYSVELFKNEVGENEGDVAKNAIVQMMEKHAKENRVVRMSDINNMRHMRKLKPNERYSTLKEMVHDGTILEVVKRNVRGKDTKTFALGKN